MTLPTLAWFPTNLTGQLGSYQAWDLSTVDAEAMVDEICGFLKAFMPTSAGWDLATIFTQASPSAPNIPVRSLTLAIAGTSIATTQSQAVSKTWNMKTLGNGNAKIVLLDTPIAATWFNKVKPVDWTTAEVNVFGTLSAVSNAFAGRDDQRVNSERSITYDLNDKLQKMYFR